MRGQQPSSLPLRRLSRLPAPLVLLARADRTVRRRYGLAWLCQERAPGETLIGDSGRPVAALGMNAQAFGHEDRLFVSRADQPNDRFGHHFGGVGLQAGRRSGRRPPRRTSWNSVAVHKRVKPSEDGNAVEGESARAVRGHHVEGRLGGGVRTVRREQ